MWLCVSILGHVEKLWYVNNEIVLVLFRYCWRLCLGVSLY